MAESEHARYDELADAELLAQFLTGRDEAAFAAMVRRHHGLVYGVCRRRLRCPHDAEDAFQATFLVLAQKAHQIRSRTSLASWLHGVACRVALRLARQRALRAAESLQEAIMVHDDPLQLLAERHEQLVTDEELAALPERLRGPIVLRYLAGKSNEQVAAELSISVPAVEGRLKRAKARLRGRLVRRGIALSTTLASIGAAKWTAAHAAEPLIAQTVAACLGASAAAATGGATTTAAAGSTAAAGLTSQIALQIARKEILAMTSLKLSNVAAIATVLVCTMTAGWGLRQAMSQPSSHDPFASGAGAGLTLDQGDPNASGGVVVGAGNPYDAAAGGEGGVVAIAQPSAGGRVDEPRRAMLQEFYDMNAFTDTQNKILGILEQHAADFTYIDIPLAEMVDDISRRFDMHIEIDHRSLQDLGIDSSTLVNAQYQGISLRAALRLMLQRLPEPLTYIIEDEYLLITTPDEAEQRLDTRIYPIRPQWGVRPSNLVTAITATVHADSWDVAGGPGSITPLGSNLVISQTQGVHEEIVNLLKQLERAAQYRQEMGYPEIDYGDDMPQKEQPQTGSLGTGLGGGGGGGGFF